NWSAIAPQLLKPSAIALQFFGPKKQTYSSFILFLDKLARHPTPREEGDHKGTPLQISMAHFLKNDIK
ncbi:hypothetical protein, partial [Geitlerinema sp. P-1104]|uniref:hypothetical protein n=1 Tax=Geitlerinema sp. P-1104 TaxID=2546230 RepID=UPI00197CE834